MSPNSNDVTKRDILPIPDVTPISTTTYDAKDPDTDFPPIVPLRPPTGAPNVLVILLDDVGFGASSAFGGPVSTPTFERLADAGLKYTRFHTTAICSPTRAALLTGRNHHTVGMGAITEIATSAPGQSSIRPNTCAPLAEVLKLNGYSTSQFGKCHEVPVWETSPMGPFTQWPTGSGFEYFYGFIGGETNQYYPAIYEGTTPIEQSKSPEDGYHFTTDMTEKAIKWVHQQKSLMADKPFFMYFAPGATHAPHHVSREWSDKYKGKFDQGFEKLREETFERQKAIGVIPRDCTLTRWNREIPGWDTVSAEMKPVLARQMEIYAGFLEHTDHHIGLLIDVLEELDILNDTLVYVIIGDNGASAEGSLQGAFNEMVTLQGFAELETPEFLRANIEKFGGPGAYNHFAVGWAHALNAPYQWTKQVASHWGGTRNGTIVHWPNGFKAKGETRSQFHHVIDVAPTVLEAARLPQPTIVNGVLQKPIEGVSMVYSFDEADAADRHETQYFETLGNRGIYHKGWTAVTKHRTPWAPRTAKLPDFDDDSWELYDTNTDWSQSNDLAKEQPERLHDLQRQWLIEATKYNVLPLDDRGAERFNSEMAGRPELVRGDHQLLFGGMGRLSESSILNLHNKTYSITADCDIPKQAEGVIIALGGFIGGWSVYAKKGILKYCYNFFGLKQFYVESTTALPEGRHQVRVEFEYDGGGPAKGGNVTLYLDGKQVGSGRVDQTQPAIFSADETCDIGTEYGSSVTADYSQREFTGAVNWVELAIGDDAKHADNSVTVADRLRIAIGVQ